MFPMQNVMTGSVGNQENVSRGHDGSAPMTAESITSSSFRFRPQSDLVKVILLVLHNQSWVPSSTLRETQLVWCLLLLGK